jgi:RNA polymerase sigma-70 factor, ECF subfamily
MSTLLLDRESDRASAISPAQAIRVKPRQPKKRTARLEDPAGKDSNAFLCSLYANHSTVLRAYVNHLISDPYQAEDIVQETMLRAWKNAEVLVPERGSVGGWLIRVAHNITVDRIRARRARPEEVDPSAAAPGSVGDHAADVVESVFVARALARLRPAHREVLRAIYFDDRTAVQVAATLGLPVGTVKSRTFHALRRLKVYLEEEMAADQ